jgi:hypothetical protein
MLFGFPLSLNKFPEIATDSIMYKLTGTWVSTFRSGRFVGSRDLDGERKRIKLSQYIAVNVSWDDS